MGASDVGYKIRSEDKLAALLEIMNENPRVEVVYFTMIWDILEGHPLPHEPVAIWHDLRVCGTSEVNPPDGQGKSYHLDLLLHSVMEYIPSIF